MSIEKPLSAKEVEDFLNAETTVVLHSNGIRDICSYGWVDADTADPEYIGHAMAQTDQPYDLGLFPPAAPPNLTPWQKDCAVSRADFQGVMGMARLSIGFAFYYGQQVRDNIFADSNLFNLHWMGSIVSLSIASDRIRELFVTSVFKQTTDDYHRDGKYMEKKRTDYVTPFLEAKDKHSDAYPQLDALPVMVDEVQVFRKTRNTIIHEIASQFGEIERKRVENQFSAPMMEIDFETLQASQKRAIAEHQKRTSSTLDMLKQWHELLIKLSNEIFVIEYKTRHPNARI